MAMVRRPINSLYGISLRSVEASSPLLENR